MGPRPHGWRAQVTAWALDIEQGNSCGDGCAYGQAPPVAPAAGPGSGGWWAGSAA